MNIKTGLAILSVAACVTLSTSAFAEQHEITTNKAQTFILTWNYEKPQQATFELSKSADITDSTQQNSPIGTWSYDGATEGSHFDIVQTDAKMTIIPVCGDSLPCYRAEELSDSPNKDYFTWFFSGGKNSTFASKQHGTDYSMTEITVGTQSNDNGVISYAASSSDKLMGSMYQSTMEVTYTPASAQ